MSYDIQIWSVNPISLPSVLSDVKKWHPEGNDFWVYPSKHWQIVVSSSVEVFLEDVPEDVAKLIPGISYLTGLTLEPIGAPKIAYKLLSAVSKRLGKAGHGVILDPQTDAIITPSGVKRYQSQRRDERFSVLYFSWYFTEGPLLTNTGLFNFINLLENMLPEAMPKRYGLFEPPQYVYSKTGRKHFLGFLQEHSSDIVVWYPHRPVVDVTISCSPKWGASRLGFRANYVRVGIEATALKQPGWDMALDRFWRAASQAIQPFFGDVRTLKGFMRRGATFGSDIKTDFHPVKGPWWIGIPHKVGHAIVLGEPYLTLWPRFIETSQTTDSLAFLSTNNWMIQEEVSNLIGGIPNALAQRLIPKWVTTSFGKTIKWNTEYPPKWPFENISVGEGAPKT